MKTHIKLLLIIFFALSFSKSLDAQNSYFLKYSPDLFLGKWTATNGDMSYEVEFTTFIMISNNGEQDEFLIGKITYCRNGEIIKKTEYDRTRSTIYGAGLRSTKKANLNFRDFDRLVWWEFEFTIDENNNNRAVWKFTKAKDDWMRMGWNETYSPDIPDNLVFRKVPNVDSGNPGGGLDPGGQK